MGVKDSIFNKERNSNIELMRIFAMLFIVMGHFVDQSGFNQYDSSVNSIIVSFFSYGARIGTNLFLLISVWFMVDNNFKVRKIIQIYSQLFFTTALITTVMIVISPNVTIKDILRGYFPLFGRALWFVSAYITLYCFAPFLKRCFELERTKQKALCMISFVAVCIVATFPDEQAGYLVDSIWFLFIFIWIGYIKHNDIIIKLKHRKISTLIPAGGITMYLILSFIYYYGHINDSKIANVGLKLSYQYLMDIKTLPNVLIAFSLFYWVITKKEWNNKTINKISKASLEVYIVHQVPALIPFLWQNIYSSNKFKEMRLSVLYVVFVAITLFICVYFFDMLRVTFIEDKWMKSKIEFAIESKLDKFFHIEDIIGWG